MPSPLRDVAFVLEWRLALPSPFLALSASWLISPSRSLGFISTSLSKRRIDEIHRHIGLLAPSIRRLRRRGPSLCRNQANGK